jgi:hypothetical protein
LGHNLAYKLGSHPSTLAGGANITTSFASKIGLVVHWDNLIFVGNLLLQVSVFDFLATGVTT